MAGRAAPDRVPTQRRRGPAASRARSAWLALCLAAATRAVAQPPLGSSVPTSIAAAPSSAGSVPAAPVVAAPADSNRVEWRAGEMRSELLVPADSLRIRLPRGWIRAASFRLSYRDTLLTRGVDFLLDPRSGRIRLLRSFPAGAMLIATWQSFPVDLQGEYARHHPAPPPGPPAPGSEPAEPGPDAARAAPAGAASASDAVKLDISGSKTFSVEVGTQKDMELKQSLDLSVAGRIGRDVKVQAVLTDRNTPLQPEGTSTQLQDLDRVLVNVEGPNARMTLGDFQLALTPMEFVRFNRQLQGARGEATRGPANVFAAAATSPGDFATREFYGQEGKQGPYSLGTGGVVSAGAIVAASEHVWLDHQPMTRGENEDYIIDYAEGTLTFTGRHPITAYSEITADFQLVTDRYQRSVIGTGASWGAAPVALPPPGAFGPTGPGGSLPSTGPAGGAAGAAAEGRSWARLVFLREADDRNRPVIPLTDFQKAALRAAGDSVTADLRSGVVLVGAGKGDYNRVQVDTIPVPFFRYAGPDSGSYQVRFEQVGDAKGDYESAVSHAGNTFYVYVGHLKGNYVPGEAVPMPQSASILSFEGAPDLGRKLSLRGDVAVSQFDRNTFSPLDDRNNGGLAFLVEQGAGPFPVGAARFDFGGRIRQIDSRFHSLDRLDPSFYALDWNVAAERLEHGDRRRSVYGGVRLRQSEVKATLEDLDNWTDFRGWRTVFEGSTRAGPVGMHGRVLRAYTEDRLGGGVVNGGRQTENATAHWPGSWVDLSGGYTRERNNRGTGKALTGDFFREGSLTLGSGSRFPSFHATTGWTRRYRYTLAGEIVNADDVGDTRQVGLDWQGREGRLVSLGWSRRDLRSRRGAGDQSSTLGRVRWVERAREDAFVQEGRWELSTSQQSNRLKQLRFVGAGVGHYDSLGVYRGIGDYEVFYQTLSDSARVNRIDFSLRNELDVSRLRANGAAAGAGGPQTAAAGGAGAGPASIWRTLHLVHYWTAQLTTDRPTSYLWSHMFPSLAGATPLLGAEVQMRADLSALPSARWLSPRLRWEHHRSYQGDLSNVSQVSRSSLWAARFRSRPAEKWTADQETEWEATETGIAVGGARGGREGWRSLRLRLDQQWGLLRSLSPGLESWTRWRTSVTGNEKARVYAATPYLVWTPQSRSRLEVRTTRTSLSHQGGAGTADRELETAGWSSRILGTLHLREELDLSLWLQEERPDHGRTVRDGRMELRATF